MKKIFPIALSALLLSLSAQAASFLVLPASPDADASGVCAYLRAQGHLAATPLPPVSIPENAPSDIGSLARSLLDAASIDSDSLDASPCVIVLGSFGDSVSQGCFLPDDHLALINLSRLAADDPDSRLARRAGQEALRIAAMSLGLASCPFHLCVLTGYHTPRDLDSMSGNCCPPCFFKLENAAKALGLDVPAED